MRLKQKLYRAAIYLRLSIEDDNRVESDSIQNQREFLKSYINGQDDIILSQEFIDDGYTGTNFDRPGFQKMMDLVQAKLLDCIIVKDFSRLGRNYIETGRYMEQIFPMLGIRFISVNDNYDSASDFNDADQIIIPFKNLINDAYCRDISIKIRSQLDVKRKSGKFIGSFATYGYLKDPKNHSHLIIDETAAGVVRMIFDWKLEGYSPGKIADKLNTMGVLTPLQYKRSIGLNCNCGFWKGEDPKWVPRGVHHILSDEIYIGTMVQGKNRKVNYKVNKLIHIDKKDWIRVPKTHEPIISEPVFQRVQDMLVIDTRTSPYKSTVDVFAGMVCCAGCGQPMTKRTDRHGEKRYVYYTCSTKKAGRGCSSHLINVNILEDTVLKAVQEHMRLLLDADELFTMMDKWPKATYQVKILEDQITNLEKEIDRYKNLSLSLYEDYRDQVISQEDYEELKLRFDEKVRNAMQSRDYNIGKMIDMTDKPMLPPEWINEVRELGKIKKLTRKAVVMLIRKIIVHSKRKIEIVFYYSDAVQFFIKEAERLRQGVSV